MPQGARKFADVFQKIPFTENVLASFAQAEVSQLVINKSTKMMHLQLSHNQPVLGSSLFELENQIKDSFPAVEDVLLSLRCNVADADAQTQVAYLWSALAYAVSKQSPLCGRILEQSGWRIEGKTLVIITAHHSSFLFEKKKLDAFIAQWLSQQAGLDFRVALENDDKGTSPAKTNEEIAKRWQQAVTQAMTNMPLPLKDKPISRPKAAPDGSQPFFEGGKKRGGGKRTVKLLDAMTGERTPLSAKLEEEAIICVEGMVIDVQTRETKKGKILAAFDIADGISAVTVKLFTTPEGFEPFKPLLKTGKTIAVKGKVQNDDFAGELNVMAHEIAPAQAIETRQDNAPTKRVELHLHTQMSAMDGIHPISVYIKRAAQWGHTAIGLTDHGVAQAYPEAMSASKAAGIKVLYGVEAYLVDDLGAVVQCAREQTLNDDFVVFDLETTGLSKHNDHIIEIGAVKVQNGVVTDHFSAFVNPGVNIPPKITELTGITNAMVKDAPSIDTVLPQFLAFAGDAVLVAHNASFDVGFVSEAVKKVGSATQSQDLPNTVLDTVELSRALFPQLSKHKLNIVAEHLGVSLENHHRAVDDATATAEIFIKCIALLREQGVETLTDINALAGKQLNIGKLKTYHAVIYAQNQTGMQHLYELISNAHILHFARRPRMLKSEILRLREGLMIGSACDAGELYQAVKDGKPTDFIRSLAEFYDYFEIQPIGNCMYMLRDGQVKSVHDLMDMNRRIVALGEQFNKPVVATCDVHFLNPEDEVYRRIIMTGEGFKDADHQAPLFYRTTEEMLAEFDYLGPEKAYEVVVENTNKVADAIEALSPIPSGKFPPFIEGAEEEIERLTMDKARAVYGDQLPPIVEERLKKELDSIIKNGFSVMYIIAQKLVQKSMEDGYLVGSRGSVGSSLVATLSGITEVNPLAPHYVCKNCRYSDFDSPEVRAFAGASGCDMPDKACPVCGEMLSKDGHDIPFETFLGFDGDKEPDIDLNFSGEYQSKAHAYTETLFGADNVFKAGTIGTLADKTAYGYVKKYMEEKGMTARNAEINRLKIGCTGIKKTTGQHPGGLVILPRGHSIYEFCPIQRPANDTNSTVTTTHFDYHSIEGRLLKLDLLGHDVPTIVRMLYDTSGVDPQTVDLGDKRVISLFTSPEALGLRPEDIGCQTGSLGLPEFGTSFVRGMLMETKPGTFSELVRISGLSHGTDVWINNAQELVANKTATLKEIIPTRDDIMVYLINKGVERKAAFKIMEQVRRGRGLTPEEEETMRASSVPDWYIDSCKKIKYMFPKGHAVAYVMMTVRIGYFKIYYPYSFYAATFSVKAEDFDYGTMCQGREQVLKEMARIQALTAEGAASAKDKNTLTLLELVNEMYARGLKFVPLDLYESDALKFKVTPKGLMPPLCAVQGLGASVAQNIVESRQDGEFVTIEDFRARTKTNKTVIELLKNHGILDGLPESNQLSLF